jgi:hypothetical protein
VGQRGRIYQKVKKEHLCAFRNNSNTSRFAQHLNDHSHVFGPIEDIMQLLYYQKKGTYLNTMERFYIHKEASSDKQLNDKYIIFSNIIFDTIIKIGNPLLRNTLNTPHPYSPTPHLPTFTDLTTPSSPSVGERIKYMYIIDTVRLVGIKIKVSDVIQNARNRKL